MTDKGTQVQERILEQKDVLTLLIGITEHGGLADLEQALSKMDAEELRLALAGAVGVIVGNYLDWKQHQDSAAVDEWTRRFGDNPTLN